MVVNYAAAHTNTHFYGLQTQFVDIDQQTTGSSSSRTSCITTKFNLRTLEAPLSRGLTCLTCSRIRCLFHCLCFDRYHLNKIRHLHNYYAQLILVGFLPMFSLNAMLFLEVSSPCHSVSKWRHVILNCSSK